MGVSIFRGGYQLRIHRLRCQRATGVAAGALTPPSLDEFQLASKAHIQPPVENVETARLL
jgi:hypothetical protein